MSRFTFTSSAVCTLVVVAVITVCVFDSENDVFDMDSSNPVATCLIPDTLPSDQKATLSKIQQAAETAFSKYSGVTPKFSIIGDADDMQCNIVASVFHAIYSPLRQPPVDSNAASFGYFSQRDRNSCGETAVIALMQSKSKITFIFDGAIKTDFMRFLNKLFKFLINFYLCFKSNAYPTFYNLSIYSSIFTNIVHFPHSFIQVIL